MELHFIVVPGECSPLRSLRPSITDIDEAHTSPQRTVRLPKLISGRELDLFRFNRLRDLQNSIRQGSGCRLTFTLVQ